MKHLKSALIIPVIFVLSANSAETITGRVVNNSSLALADTKVWIKSHPEVIDSTGIDGKFSLASTPSKIRSFADPRSGEVAFSLHKGYPVLSLMSQQWITVELFDILGVKVVTVFKGWKGRGTYSFAQNLQGMKLATGQYLLTFQSGNSEGTVHVSVSGNHKFIYTEAPALPAGRQGSAKSAAADDTLIVLRMGHEIKKIPLVVASPQNLGDISLKSRTYRLDTAVAVPTGRRVEVYVPSDYQELYQLPVLYLLHGGGANEAYWRANCRFLDSLNTFADRVNVQAMIIVTPSAGGNTNYGNYGKTADPFYTELTTGIRNYIESHYKADTSRYSRAISGLSMGSMQTWNLTVFYPKLWGYSFPMSGGLFKSSGFSRTKMKSDLNGKLIDITALNEMKLFKVYSNPTDAAYGDTDSTSMLADSLGIKHTTDFTTRTMGGHTDPYWNEVFRKYATLLFK